MGSEVVATGDQHRVGGFDVREPEPIPRPEPVGFGEDLGRARDVEQFHAVEDDDDHLPRCHLPIVSHSVGKTAEAPYPVPGIRIETGVSKPKGPAEQGDSIVNTSTAETIADIVIPDTALVRDVTAYIRDTEDDLLYHHSRRVYLFGALHARRRGLRPDLELLYTGAMFHNLGLTDGYRDSQLHSPIRQLSILVTSGIETVRITF